MASSERRCHYQKFDISAGHDRPGRLGGCGSLPSVQVPLGMDRKPGREIELVDKLRAAPRDVLIVGDPGTDKTRLAKEAAGVRFVNHEAGTQHWPSAFAVISRDMSRLTSRASIRWQLASLRGRAG